MSAQFFSTVRVSDKLRGLLSVLGLLPLLAACGAGAYELENTFGGISPTLRLIFFGVGLVLLIVGYALHELILEIVGFLVGAVLGAGLALSLSDGDSLAALIGFVFGGLTGLWLGVLMAYIGIFGAGFLVGAALCASLWMSLFRQEAPSLVVFLASILTGAAMVVLYRIWITGFTAAVGAVLMGMGMELGAGWWLILFVVGVAFQLIIARMTGHLSEAQPHFPASTPTVHPPAP